MTKDGIQLWNHTHRHGEEVHAARQAVTLCGRWMPSRVPLWWLPVLDHNRVTCKGCAAALKLREVALADHR